MFREFQVAVGALGGEVGHGRDQLGPVQVDSLALVQVLALLEPGDHDFHGEVVITTSNIALAPHVIIKCPG